MVGFFGKLFAGKAGDIVKSVGDLADNLFTSKEEKAAFELKLKMEINRHLEALAADATEQYKIEVDDRKSAREREASVIKSLGRMDYMMVFLGVSGIAVFFYLVYSLVNKADIPTHNLPLVHNILGIVEGFIISMFTYYFGSSAGSRAKDMK